MLPFVALKLLLTRPRLLLLSFFPGALTFALTTGLLYLLWTQALDNVTLWLSLPASVLIFLLSWIVFGSISLVFVEDAIIDECQRAQLGEVRIPAPPFHPRRLARELGHACLVAVAACALFALSFVPFLNLLNILLAAWLTAYIFLAPIFARTAPSYGARLRLFAQNPGRNLLLGFFLNFLLFVPVLNVFLLGYAQILATLVFLKTRT